MLVVLTLRSNPPLLKYSPFGEGWRHFRASLIFLLICAALGLAGLYYFRSSLNHQIGEALLRHLNHKLATTGWRVDFRSFNPFEV